MDWRNATLLIWLLPLLSGWIGLSIFAIYRNRTARGQFMDRFMAEKLMPKLSIGNQVSKLVLQVLGVSAILIALAGPQFGEQMETIVPKGSDLYILLDVSRSMLANDVPPSRLERAKADIGALVNSLTGERVGLIAFAGQAVVKVPLTVDYESFRRTLADVDTTSAPRGGTAIGDAIRKALEVFKPNSQRDQAILLITDGDDQKSAPLEAADVAAERSVTIFTVGLGDSTQGARIPAKDRSGQFVEYEGEQVWSKLDSSLLEQLALKTNGVFIPAGTKNYDLREIYTNYLADRRGDTSETQTRIRRGEQFQWFLGIGVLFLLIDLMVKPHRSLPLVGVEPTRYTNRSVLLTRAAGLIFIAIWLGKGVAIADDSASIQQGLRHYENQEFEKASETFGKAAELLRDTKSQEQHIAYFDQACAEHRLGNRNKAIELYLLAAMAKDRSLAARANFNLARVHVDAAKEIWQDGSQIIEKKDDREKLIDEARQAIAAYRASLELDPKETTARKNIEIVRQWLKVVTDQWDEFDRNKRRRETDLIQFLDYIQSTQSDILNKASKLEDLYQLDSHAELKLLQDNLLDEFPFLNEKIEEALNPQDQSSTTSPSAEDKKEIQKVLDMMLGWSDKSREQMKVASTALGRFRASEALEHQQQAIDELNNIWNAIAPIEQTLQRAIVEQREVEKSLKPFEEESTTESVSTKTIREQQRVALRAMTLKPKAEGMLAELSSTDESSQQSKEQTANQMPEDQKEQKKKFLNKAIELSPNAVAEMKSSTESLNKNDGQTALIHAREARRILEEIKKEQKSEEQNQNQDNQNQDSKEQNEQSQESSGDEQQEQQKSDQQKDQSDDKQKDSSDESNDQSKPNEQEDGKDKKSSDDRDDQQDEKTKEDQKEKDSNGAADPKSLKDDKKPSQDRIAEALRRVREREAEKRDRDRQRRLKAYGQYSVEKDW